MRTWLELTDNPDSYMMLMDNDADGLPDPATEIRVPLHRGARFVVDTQRLWHVVVHPGDAPRYALITSFESSPALDAWIDAARSPPASDPTRPRRPATRALAWTSRRSAPSAVARAERQVGTTARGGRRRARRRRA